MNDSVEKKLYEKFYGLIDDMRLTKKNEFYKRDKENVEQTLYYWKTWWFNDTVFPTDTEYARFVIETLYDKLFVLTAVEYKKFAIALLEYDM